MAWSDAARAAAAEARRRHAHTKENIQRATPSAHHALHVPVNQYGKPGFRTRAEMVAFLRDQRSVGARGREALHVASKFGLHTSSKVAPMAGMKRTSKSKMARLVATALTPGGGANRGALYRAGLKGRK